MRIIDKTPYQDKDGKINLIGRLQGTLDYGFSWYPEMQAQASIIEQLERALEKKFTLIRNLTLPGSEITEPLILIGPPGLYVIYVTHLRGFYEARGDQWNLLENGRARPAAVNLIRRVMRLARALQVYLERQGITLPAPVEPVLIAADPAMHIESVRPAVRVIMSDAVRQFAATLLQTAPLLRAEVVNNLVDHILEPRPKSAAPAAVAPPPPSEAPRAPDEEAAARAQAIFRASEEVRPFDPSQLSFAFEEEEAAPGEGLPPGRRERSPAQPLRRPPVVRRGLSRMQVMILAGMFLVELCVLAGFGYFIFFGNR